MKYSIIKLLTILSTIAILLLSTFMYGCGNDKYINGKKYGTYGFLNEDSMKNPNLEYRIIWGNVVWAYILIGTFIVPVYFFGFSIFEPIGSLNSNKEKGEIPWARKV